MVFILKQFPDFLFQESTERRPAGVSSVSSLATRLPMIDIVMCLSWIVDDCPARRDLEVAETLVHPRRPTEEDGDVLIC